MRVKFLGTAHGVPMSDRYCQSILVETNSGKLYLFDAGAPVLDILVRENYDIRSLQAVFLTHLHGDHMNGLLNLLYLPQVFDLRYQVFVPEQRGIDLLKNYAWMQSIGVDNEWEERIAFHMIEKGICFDDGVMKVTAYPTCHMEEAQAKSFGFLIEADGESLYITGDMHRTLKDFPIFLKENPVDMLVTECAHFSVEALVEKLTEIAAKKVTVVHVYPMEKYEVLKRMKQSMPFELVLPDDGDVVLVSL